MCKYESKKSLQRIYEILTVNMKPEKPLNIIYSLLLGKARYGDIFNLKQSIFRLAK